MGMIDREKVIKNLEICASGYCEGCTYYKPGCLNLGCLNRLKMDVLVLLKEQEAVEPVMDIDTWKCGKCGHTLEHQELLGDIVLFHEQYNYCPECGKRVK